jgi:hypothetical protein
MAVSSGAANGKIGAGRFRGLFGAVVVTALSSN